MSELIRTLLGYDVVASHAVRQALHGQLPRDRVILACTTAEPVLQVILSLNRTLEERALRFTVLDNCVAFINAARLLHLANDLLMLIFYIFTEAEPFGGSICLRLPPSGNGLGI